MLEKAAPLDLIHRVDERVLTNSRDVASFFGKPHKDVLRSIATLLDMQPDLAGRNFAPGTYRDENNQERPCYDMDRDGFSLLAMGFTGEKALRWKLLYIEAFNEMERGCIAKLDREQVSLSLRERFQLARATAELSVKVEDIGDDVRGLRTEFGEFRGEITRLLKNKRREISQKTKNEHIETVKTKLGGLCPHCTERQLFDAEGYLIPFADFDHFYANHFPNAEHTWLICRPCHNGLTSNRFSRNGAFTRFDSYQIARRAMPKKQRSLFDLI